MRGTSIDVQKQGIHWIQNLQISGTSKKVRKCGTSQNKADMGYINFPTKSGYIILDTDWRYIHIKKKETTD